MTPDFEEALRGSLHGMVNTVDADPDHLERAVTHRASSARRKRSAFVATGVAAAVALAVGAPVVVLQHTGRAAVHPADPTVSTRLPTPIGYGRRLVSMVELPPGGTPIDSSPTRSLDHAAWGMSFSPEPQRVTRWWTYDRSAASIWSWVSHHKNPGLSWQGTMGSGFPVVPRTIPRRSSVELQPTAGPPPTFVFGDVVVAVAALGRNRAALAVVATVQPRRSIPVYNQVPTTGVVVDVAWRHEPGSPVIHTRLTGSVAGRLAKGLNVLPMADLGPHGCLLMRAQNDVEVTFTAGGHTWRATLGGCFDISVTLDGAPLAVLAPYTSEGTGAPRYTRIFEKLLQAQGIRLP
jgi:hypothetical protein